MSLVILSSLRPVFSSPCHLVCYTFLMRTFVPSDTPPRLNVLPAAFQVMPPAVARAAIEQHTQPGDVILDPFVSGLGVIQAALETGRRLIAASFNPINAEVIRATLWPTDARTAFTHLEDALRTGRRWQENIARLYTVKCPTCRQPAMAQHFIWDRERRQPVEKHVDCAVCGENAGPIEEDDLKELKRLDARGLPFWLLHNRVIDRQHEDADRVGDVLDVYTPRAQLILSDILLKFDLMSEEERAALRPALLATFDTSTSLHTPDETRYPSGLKPPQRFVERNVWLELERQVSLLPAVSPAVPRADTLDELFASPAPAVCVQVLPARELARRLPGRSIPLVVTHPPLPRPGFWSLSAVWASWLWGKQSNLVDHLRPLLSRKRTSWDWQWRAIGSALNVLNPVLKEDARIVMSFPAEEAVLDSVSLAAAQARQTTEHMVCDPLDGVRATWRVTGEAEQSGHLPAPDDVLCDIVEARAEPTHEIILRTGLLTAWGKTATLMNVAQQAEGEQTPLALLRSQIDQALNTTSLYEIDPHYRWLTRSQPQEASLASPLADRVEQQLRTLLQQQAEWHGDELLAALYQHFPEALTPDRALVATVIHSYAEDLNPERIRLRAEDQPQARQAEVEEMRDWLFKLGERFGLEVRAVEPLAAAPRISWANNEETLYTFVIQSSAQVQPLLQVDAAVLVIPGGRATLLQHKLARDPRLRQNHWQILKCNSLRRAALQPELSLVNFPLAFGLDPVIEQPAMQIQLL